MPREIEPGEHDWVYDLPADEAHNMLVTLLDEVADLKSQFAVLAEEPEEAEQRCGDGLRAAFDAYPADAGECPPRGTVEACHEAWYPSGWQLPACLLCPQPESPLHSSDCWFGCAYAEFDAFELCTARTLTRDLRKATKRAEEAERETNAWRRRHDQRLRGNREIMARLDEAKQRIADLEADLAAARERLAKCVELPDTYTLMRYREAVEHAIGSAGYHHGPVLNDLADAIEQKEADDDTP